MFSKQLFITKFGNENCLTSELSRPKFVLINLWKKVWRVKIFCE